MCVASISDKVQYSFFFPFSSFFNESRAKFALHLTVREFFRSYIFLLLLNQSPLIFLRDYMYMLTRIQTRNI